MKQYKILSLEAADIYDNTKFDGNGKKVKSDYIINSVYKKEDEKKEVTEKLSSYFSATMKKNLDLLYFCKIEKAYKIFNEITLNKGKYNEHKYVVIPHFVNVEFNKVSHEYKLLYKDKKDSKDKKEEKNNSKDIYIKRGYNISLSDIKGKLEDSIYIINNEIVAIRINEIVKENKINDKNNFFKYDETEKCYKKISTKKEDISTKELRKELYKKEGFSIKLDGKRIEYIRYKRSSSNARSGHCLFINKKYFDKMNDWTYIDEEFKTDKIVLNLPVEIEAYKSLSLSSLEKTIELEPKNILVVEDKTSIYMTECINVNIENKKLVSKKENTGCDSNIWDGEGLLDKSVFDCNGYGNKGMLLLRNRYFKSCVFNTNLQKFFKDNNITEVSQLNGFTKAKNIEDIKMVVTHSSLKILKFSDAKDEQFSGNKKEINEYIINYWMDKADKTFGVVKTDKPTHRFNGNMVRTSYQILNTLGLNEEETMDLLKPTIDYVNKMKEKSPYFSFYLDNEKDSNDNYNYYEDINDFVDKDDEDVDITDEFFKYKNDICLKLLKINKDFDKTRLYSNFRSKTLQSIRKDIKSGRILVDGTYATIFGNGYELLLNTIKDIDANEIKPIVKRNEVYTKMFKENENIVGVRFPHVSTFNFYLAKNVYTDDINNVYNKYFNLTKEIIVVNSIGESIQQRLNGMDFDSDTLLITNNKIIYKAVKRHYHEFLVPVNAAEGSNETFKIDRAKDLYDIDDKISNNYIGRIINLSQWLNSILWDKYDKTKKIDYDLLNDISKLAVLSNMEIDKAKRPYDVNAIYEMNSIINKIKSSDYDSKPKFMGKIQKEKDDYNVIDLNNYKDYNTTMGYVNRINFSGGRQGNRVFLYDIMNKDVKIANTTTYGDKAEKAYEILKRVGDEITELNSHKLTDKDDKRKRREDIQYLLNNAYKDIVDKKYLNNSIAVKLLLKKVEGNNRNNIQNIEKYLWPLLYVLYIANENNEEGEETTACGETFYKLFKTKENPKRLKLDENGEEELYSKRYRIE